MSFIDTIHPSEAEGEVREMYERQQASWGYVPNYAQSFSLRPEVLARWGRLLAEIRRPMSDRRFELVTTVAAYVYRHTACSLAHGKKLADIISEDAVLAIVTSGDSPMLTDAEREMVRYARKIAADASSVTAGDVDRLKAHGLDDGEIFDIAAAVAGRAFFTKLLDALGSEPDQAFGRLSEAMRATLTVGRPIAVADSPRLAD
jgi:uncharacterized peroxidase-related enzyme